MSNARNVFSERHILGASRAPPAATMAPSTRGKSPSPFGEPFTFGKPLFLNSQPPSPRDRAPLATVQARASSSGRGAVARRPPRGYGVTPPASYPPASPPLTRTTGSSPSETSRERVPFAAAASVAPASPGVPTSRDGEVLTWVDERGVATDLPPEDTLPKPSDKTSKRANAAARRLKHQRVANRAASARVRARPPPLAPAFPTAAQFAARGVDAVTVVVADRAAAKIRDAKSAPPIAFGGRPPPRPKPETTRETTEDEGTSFAEEREPDELAPENFRERPRAAGPAFSFGVKPKSGTGSLWGAHGKDSPGPAAYYDPYPETASDAIRGHVPAPSIGAGKPPTFGDSDGDDVSKKRRRGGGSGYVWDAFPGADPDTPGPGQYYDAEKDAMVAGRGPSFTIGGGKDDVGKVPSRGGEDVPGPGAYDVVGAPDDGDVRGSRNKGFTFGGKVGVDWASTGPGRDAPAVGKYFRDLDKLGGDVRDSVKGPGGRGPAFSFGTAPARPRDDPTTGPGPGDYHRDGDDDTNANDAKTEKDAKTKSNRSGFTFGYRREPGDGGVGPGPGAYQPNVFPEDDDPDALRQGPAFTLAPKLRVGGAVDVSGDKARVPGPGEYDADGDGVGGNFAGPAFTVSGKVPGPSGEEKRAREVPGPGQYAVAATVGEGAPAFTMYARVEDPTLRASSELPGPGAYGVPVAPGAELSHPTRGAASVRGREAWANTGWGAGAEGLPGPAEYVTSATARPIASAPSFTMGARAETGEKSPGGRGSSAPGPGEYDRDGDVPARPDGPSFTFGHRVSVGGALGHLGEKAAQPGPGQYHDRDARARAAAGPSFTFGVKTEVPSDDRVGPSGYSERPGPGEYHDENREPPLGGDGPGFTMYERFPPAGAEAAATGADGPGPAFYVGPWTAKDLDRGAGVSLAPGMMTNHDAPGGLMDVVKARATIPGPGFYTPEVFQFPRRDGDDATGSEPGEFLWAPKGYTFGWRGAFGDTLRDPVGETSPGPGEYYPDDAERVGEAPWRPAGFTIGLSRSASARSATSGDPGPGPGEYYVPEDTSRGSAGRRGPKRGARIQTRRPWERAAAREKRGDAPGPAEYAPGAGLRKHVQRRAPAHAVGQKQKPSKSKSAPAPGPGDYDVEYRPIGAGAPGATVGVRFATRDDAAAYPAPGEYHRDDARSAKKTSVNIAKGATRDAPGGVFDAARRAASTPGPGEFDAAFDAARRRNAAAVDIARGTGREAPGGALDVARRGADNPGPGEHWPDDNSTSSSRKKNARGFSFARTGHGSVGGAHDAARRAADEPGPGEFWPDEDVRAAAARRKKSGAGYTIPRTGHGAVGGALDAARRAANEPGPGDFWPEDAPGGSVGRKKTSGYSRDIGKTPGRDAAWGSSDVGARDSPGPGAHWPDETDARANANARGVSFGKPPRPKPPSSPSRGPGPGEYEVLAERARGAGSMPRAARRFATGGSARDGDDRPAPGDHEPEVHPKTVAGLLRDAMRQPGSLRPPTKTRKVRWADEDGDPGPGNYDAPKNPNVGKNKGATVASRKAWERAAAREARGSGLAPSRYGYPNRDAASRGLTVARRAPRGNDFEETRATTKSSKTTGTRRR